MRVSSIDHANSGTTGTKDSYSAEALLEIHGPMVFERYLNSDGATQNACTPDGWFKTGDLAIIDASGNLQLIDRSKELIIVDGCEYVPHELECSINQARISGVAKVSWVASRTVCLNPVLKRFTTYVVYQHKNGTHDNGASRR